MCSLRITRESFGSRLLSPEIRVQTRAKEDWGRGRKSSPPETAPSLGAGSFQAGMQHPQQEAAASELSCEAFGKRLSCLWRAEVVLGKRKGWGNILFLYSWDLLLEYVKWAFIPWSCLIQWELLTFSCSAFAALPKKLEEWERDCLELDLLLLLSLFYNYYIFAWELLCGKALQEKNDLGGFPIFQDIHWILILIFWLRIFLCAFLKWNYFLLI